MKYDRNVCPYYDMNGDGEVGHSWQLVWGRNGEVGQACACGFTRIIPQWAYRSLAIDRSKRVGVHNL